MAKAGTVTWAEVCQKVRLGDGLYSTCREKVTEYKGYPDLASPPPADTADFSERIARTAVPIPEPPPADWHQPAPLGMPEAHGQLSEVMMTALPTKLLWGALGALVLLLLMSKKKEQGETTVKSA
jgi:hypothetical protein